jgi:hypothetical protein
MSFNFYRGENAMLKNLILAVIAATVVGVVVSMAPDLKRYVKMSMM